MAGDSSWSDSVSLSQIQDPRDHSAGGGASSFRRQVTNRFCSFLFMGSSWDGKGARMSPWIWDFTLSPIKYVINNINFGKVLTRGDQRGLGYAPETRVRWLLLNWMLRGWLFLDATTNYK